MVTITFDTHAYIKKLKAVGVTEEQAEVQAETLAGLISDQLPTKQDIELLCRDMKEVEIKISGEINLIKWMMGFVLAGIAALILKSFFT
ncbi:MAG: DUF1640 domain-containing protein [Deltaproteobacteria bacterium]|nr:DUF1640 domain-containing protein [Deltaproteobacteria bacterium]